MKRHSRFWAVLALSILPVSVLAQGTAFTYQGRLVDGGQPANGNYDLQFALMDAPSGGSQIGATLTNAPVTVSNGLFAVLLDFGNGTFSGSARWLEIGVRTNGSSGSYTLLSPRQAITATPYAILANTAAGLVPGALITANGAGITNLDGQAIQPGTISSNKLDAPAAAQLALAGSNLPLPVVYLNSSGTYIYQGQQFTPTNSLTCGIQEAIWTLCGTNGARNSGGKIVLGPGVFRTYANISLPTGSNRMTLDVAGSGMLATIIAYVGTATQSVFTVGHPGLAGENDVLSFNMRDLTMGSTVNGLTNLLYFNAPNGPNAAVMCVSIRNCWFMGGTNTYEWPGPGWAQNNLIGIDINLQWEGYLDISYNYFTDLICGIAGTAHWGIFHHNFFERCGRWASKGTGWPASSPFFMGPCVLFTAVWTDVSVLGNIFVWTGLHYACTSAGGLPITIWQDKTEGANVDLDYGQVLAATVAVPFTFVASDQLLFTPNAYAITNTQDYSTWKTCLAPSSLVSFVNFQTGAGPWQSASANLTNWSQLPTNVLNQVGGVRVSSFNSRTGAVTLGPADVTNALGFMPGHSSFTGNTGFTSNGVPFTFHITNGLIQSVTSP